MSDYIRLGDMTVQFDPDSYQLKLLGLFDLGSMPQKMSISVRYDPKLEAELTQAMKGQMARELQENLINSFAAGFPILHENMYYWEHDGNRETFADYHLGWSWRLLKSVRLMEE